MTTYYDDNFGHYTVEDESDVEFYHDVQRRSVEKQCAGCGRTVHLLPEYGYCNDCATKRELGYEE